MLEFLIGILLGAFFHRIYVDIRLRILEKRIESKIQSTLTELKKSVIDSKIEFVDGMYFLYNRETNEFLAQGKNYDELEEAARKKYPNKLFNVPQTELTKITGENCGSK